MNKKVYSPRQPPSMAGRRVANGGGKKTLVLLYKYVT
jgi:hypothetical protein